MIWNSPHIHLSESRLPAIPSSPRPPGSPASGKTVIDVTNVILLFDSHEVGDQKIRFAVSDLAVANFREVLLDSVTNALIPEAVCSHRILRHTSGHLEVPGSQFGKVITSIEIGLSLCRYCRIRVSCSHCCEAQKC